MNGDSPTLECLACRVPRLHNYLLRRGFEDHVAAKAVEKTVKVAEKYLADGRAHTLRRPVPWLYRVAFNAAVRISTTEVRCTSLTNAIPSRPADHDAVDRQTSKMHALLQDGISLLSFKQQQAIKCRFVLGLAIREAALMMNISVATYRVHLNRAYTNLRKHLGSHPAFAELFLYVAPGASI